MAVLALGFVGSAIGGSIGGSILGVTAASIGGFIGSTIGGLVDNMLFAGSTKVEGPRLEDRRVQVSSYGLTIPKCYGPSNRIAGTVIWSTGLIETVKKTKQGGKGGPSVTTTEYSYRVSFALLLGEGPCSGVKRIWANSKVIYDRDGVSSPPVTEVVFSAMRFYPGDGAQLPDPTIESYLGVGNTPAYRHRCYIVIDDLQLADFGNRLPNIEVELEADAEITLPAVVTDLAVRSGARENELSTTALPREAVLGYVIGGSSRGTDALQPLAFAYYFDVAEQGGNLRFVPRDHMIKGMIPESDMGAFEGEPTQLPEPIRFEHMPPTGLPQKVVITYTDPARDLQRNSQPARRNFGEAASNLSHDVPLTLTADQARHIAERALYEAWTGRTTAAFKTTSRWMHIRAGDAYAVQGPSRIIRVKITRALRGVNGLVEFEGREDDASIYSSTSVGVEPPVPENTLRPVGETVGLLLDIVLLRDTDDDTGFYWTATGLGTGWRGADLLRSTDGGATYDEVDPAAVSAITGTVATATPTGPVDVWDRATTITVVLHRDDFELSSVTDLAVLNGANFAWIGPPGNPVAGEIIQFTDATLIAPGVYELSGLLRGRVGTEYAVGVHGANETFLLLQAGAMQRADFGASDWNKSRLYKAVSALTDPSAVAAQLLINTGEAKRPRSPVHVRGERDGSDNLTITWVRRSRYRAPGLGNGDVPLGEAFEAYEVDIYSGSTVVRTIQVTSPEAEYTAAEQTSDGLTPGDPVDIRVFQMSDVRGRGHGATATV